MSESWYYVENEQRIGPVDEDELKGLIHNKIIDGDTYVWKKGMENWEKLREVVDLQDYASKNTVFDWTDIDFNKSVFSIRQNSDTPIYGPYSLNFLIKLYKENRVNGHSLIFTPGLSNWTYLAEIPIYTQLFNDGPPPINQREEPRKPFVARILFHNGEDVFEGVCRDLSVGGTQVLIADFPGKIKEEVFLNIHQENTHYKISAKGIVSRILNDKSGVFIRFKDLDSAASELIKSYMEEDELD